MKRFGGTAHGDAQGCSGDVDGGEVLVDDGEVPRSEPVEPLDGIVESKEEEVDVTKIVPTPYAPSQSEIDEHCADHLPYRSWCKQCVEGFGLQDAHQCHSGEPRVPIVSMGYMIPSQRGIFERSEWHPVEGESYLKVRVVRDSNSRCVFGHAVPVKGVDSGRYVVDSVVDDSTWQGYARALLKAVNEPAVAKVISEALKGLRIEGRDAADEHSGPMTTGSAES